MKQIKFFGMLLALMMPLLVFNACGDDDDVELDSYIIGKWTSYQLKVSLNNEEKTFDITKTGKYSIYYCELNFKNNGIVTASSYDIDEDTGLSEWETEDFHYTLGDGVVNITDGEDRFQLILEGNRLYLRQSEYDEYYGLATMFVYFKK